MTEKKSKESVEEKAPAEQTEAGSSDELIKPAPSIEDAGGEADSKASQDINLDDYVSKKDYEEAVKKGQELEKKMGEQGRELGDTRKFFDEMEPLLKKLDNQPEVIQAILDDKIDSELAQNIMDGKVSVKEATEVAEAHKEVKKEMGTKEYAAADPKEIEKQVLGKLDEKFENYRSQEEQSKTRKEFMDSVDAFVANTPDFEKYAADIEKFLEENPNESNIQLIYKAVKQDKMEAAAKAEAEKKAAEEQKNLAANAAGGGSQGRQIIDNKDLVDELIGGKSNPNVL